MYIHSHWCLQFEKILVIGFSERSDKRDAITLGASYTGLEVDWIEAVRSQDMNPKAYPAVSVPFGLPSIVPSDNIRHGRRKITWRSQASLEAGELI